MSGLRPPKGGCQEGMASSLIGVPEHFAQAVGAGVADVVAKDVGAGEGAGVGAGAAAPTVERVATKQNRSTKQDNTPDRFIRCSNLVYLRRKVKSHAR